MSNQGVPSVVKLHPRLVSTTIDTAIAAALTGFGLTNVLAYKVADHLRGGRLKTVLSQFEPPALPPLLALGCLEGFGDVYPHQLSGDMRRRVALFMTLAYDPRILLLDEPFGALDTHTMTLLHRELIGIWRHPERRRRRDAPLRRLRS